MKQANQPVCARFAVAQAAAGLRSHGCCHCCYAIGLIAMQNARTTVAGTLLPVSEADAAAYGISAVYQLDNGSYRVEGSQEGLPERMCRLP